MAWAYLAEMFFPTLSIRNLMLALSMAGIFAIVMNGKVKYTQSDPQLTLLTSQSILETGSIRLDYYFFSTGGEKLTEGKWQLYYDNNSKYLYYAYPLGNSFLSVPIVGLANFFGMDMNLQEHDEFLQILVSAFLCMFIFLMLFKIAALLLDEWSALLVALALSLGTTYLSTIGTALWSFNFEVFFMLFVLYHILRSELDAGHKFPGLLIGAMLAAAWICRPTALVFDVFAFGWIVIRRPAFLNKTAIAASAVAGSFMIFSMIEFGTMVPKYYNPSSWNKHISVLEGIPALLFSPARGLFIFSPLLLTAFSGFAFRNLRKNILYLLLLGWFAGQMILVGRHDNWWGGWCFGPRLLTDLLPCLSLMLVLSLKEWATLERKKWRTGLSAWFMGAGVFGIYVHTFQGMYNPEVITWNDQPNIDFNSRFYAWNWSYPQFKASLYSNQLKKKEYELQRQAELQLLNLEPGVPILWGKPGKEQSFITHSINRRNLPEMKGSKLYSSLYTILTEGADEFYFTSENLAEVEKSGQFEIDTLTGKRKLCDLLEQNQNRMVLISGKDEVTSSISDCSRLWLRRHGSKIDSLKYRHSYILVMNNGKIIFEEMGDRPLEWKSEGPEKKFLVQSSGNTSGNQSSIRVDYWEYSQNARGMNVAVLDKNYKVIEVAHFDTHKQDLESRFMLKAKRKAGSNLGAP